MFWKSRPRWLGGGSSGDQCGRDCERTRTVRWRRRNHKQSNGINGAISALETLDRASTITVVTDSSYVKDGVSTWIHGWKRNGWKTAAKKPVKNVELWQRLDAAQARHNVTWEWVKGHAGHPENERADALARAGMEPYKPK